MKLAEKCLLGFGNNGKVCIWFRKIEGKQSNLLIMTCGYRSTRKARMWLQAHLHLKRAFFSRRIFYGRN
jgi:hypothetical protein